MCCWSLGRGQNLSARAHKGVTMQIRRFARLLSALFLAAFLMLPPLRDAGIIVETVDELVEKLKNEAKVIT